MACEWCPGCRALRNMRATQSRRKVVDSDGNARTVVTSVLHCEECNSFVRSEDVEEPAGQ